MAASAVVEFLLKYSEAGGELPTKVARELDRLAQGGGKMRESFLGATEGVGQLRRGLEILAERAIGIEGPIGRVSAGLLRLGAGGEVTLAVIAGVGAIGFAIQKITEPANAASEAMTKFADGLKSSESPMQRYNELLGKIHEGIAKTALAAQVAQQAAGSTGPIGSAIGTIIGLFAGKSTAAAEGAAGTGLDAVYTVLVQSQTKYIDNLRHEVELTGASVRLRAQMLAQWAGLDEGGQREAVRLSLELATRQELLRIEKERARLFEHERDLFRGDRANQAMALSIAGIRLSQPYGIFQTGVTSGPLPGLEPGTVQIDPNLTRDILFRIGASQGLNMPFEDIGNAGSGGGKGVDVQRLIAASFAAVGSAQGGFGGALAGIGGMAAAIPGLQVPGAILSGFGGLVSLFTGGGARVTISQLDQTALDQLRNTIQLPTYLSEVITNVNPNNLRGTVYQQGRMTARDTVPRTY